MMAGLFIKNTLNVEVDGLRGINKYSIKAMYDVKQEDARGHVYYTVEHKLLDEFTLTWDEIESEGGMAAVNRELRDYWNIAEENV